MARKTSEKVGRGPCPSKGCSGTVMFRRSSGGMLTHSCDSCDSTGYAEPGGDACTTRMASIENPTSAAPAPSPNPPPDDKAPPRGRSVFDLGSL